MKQNTRKNKTNQSVVWPTTEYFTIADLHKLNPKFVNITLRVRLANAIGAGQVAEIGWVPGGKGRPPKVFSLTPVQQSTLNKAKEGNVNLVDNAQKLVNVINVSTPTSPATVTNPVADPNTVSATN
jgi:hypothetical protein